jgi:hypothetical protein
MIPVSLIELIHALRASAQMAEQESQSEPEFEGYEADLSPAESLELASAMFLSAAFNPKIQERVVLSMGSRNYAIQAENQGGEGITILPQWDRYASLIGVAKGGDA